MDRIITAVDRAGGAQAVATACGIQRSAVYQWRDGTTKSPKGENLLVLAREAKVRFEWLIAGEQPMEAPDVNPEQISSLLVLLGELPPAVRYDETGAVMDYVRARLKHYLEDDLNPRPRKLPGDLNTSDGAPQ